MSREKANAVDVARISFWVPVEVRYSDLDAQGHVNNATFFTYFEQGRVAFFAELRVRYSEHTASSTTTTATLPGADAPDLPFVVASASCAYRRPIAGLAPVSVGVRCSRLTHATIEMEYAVCAVPGGLLYATGTTSTVSVDPNSGRPRALPAWALHALERMSEA